MKLAVSTRERIIIAVCLSYMLLFVYAAVSKLADYQVFLRQLGMSPVLTSHASWLAWVVPAAEILLSLLLAFRRTRTAGLFGCLCLMASFTMYIYLILNHASHVPCSCGGILEKMGWIEHFYFNLAFMILALLALILDAPQDSQFNIMKGFQLLILLGGVMLSSGLTLSLFIISERIVHYENRFERRYPHPAVSEIAREPLPHNSYYVAGFSKSRVYLGNVTAPLHVISCSYKLKDFESYEIKLDTAGMSFSTAQVRVQDDKFYLYNGTVPYVFDGSVRDWLAVRSEGNPKRFTLAEIMGKEMAVRTFSESGEHILGVQRLSSEAAPRYNEAMLHKQADGIFDTDGVLLSGDGKFVYLYYYRNEFLVSDASLKIALRGNTIDTTSRAQVTIAETWQGLRQMGQAPLLVNRRAALEGSYLFVNSQLPGKGDFGKLWKQASIIDVYDIRDGSYRFSFPLYDIDGQKLESFRIIRNHIFLINEKWIVRYDLEKGLVDGP
ncbi:DoxX family protein [Flavobacterium qiangtangense]|uniref:DoxX family protein n=1 Tax=Flavobacterium qiangtangense TaxID=1442595 RepID=A0ABW1PKU8_9FLAO